MIEREVTSSKVLLPGLDTKLGAPLLNPKQRAIDQDLPAIPVRQRVKNLATLECPTKVEL
jgi:hypothetical protein